MVRRLVAWIIVSLLCAVFALLALNLSYNIDRLFSKPAKDMYDALDRRK